MTDNIWYVGMDNEGIMHTFSSHTLPTRKSHGNIYEKVYGPFESKSYADRFAEYMVKN